MKGEVEDGHSHDWKFEMKDEVEDEVEAGRPCSPMAHER